MIYFTCSRHNWPQTQPRQLPLPHTLQHTHEIVSSIQPRQHFIGDTQNLHIYTTYIGVLISLQIYNTTNSQWHESQAAGDASVREGGVKLRQELTKHYLETGWAILASVIWYVCTVVRMPNKIAAKISLAGIQNVWRTTSEVLLDELLKMLDWEKEKERKNYQYTHHISEKSGSYSWLSYIEDKYTELMWSFW